MTLYDTIALSQNDIIAREKRETKQGEAEKEEWAEHVDYLFMRLLAFWLAASMRDTLRTACAKRKAAR